MLLRADQVLSQFERAVGRSSGEFDAAALAISRAGGLGNLDDLLRMRLRDGTDTDFDRPWQWLDSVAQGAIQQGEHQLAIRVFMFVSYWCGQIAPKVSRADWSQWVLTSPSDPTRSRLAATGVDWLSQMDRNQHVVLLNGESLMLEIPLIWCCLQLVELTDRGVPVRPDVLALAHHLLKG
jgi:hypothetical protein